MWLRSRILFSWLLTICSTAIALAIPLQQPSYASDLSVTPRISCTILDQGLWSCKKFTTPIEPRTLNIPSQRPLLNGANRGSDRSISEDRQIESIMDVKKPTNEEEERGLWSIPDVQVVMWFVLLCCLAEGVVAGIRWWSGSATKMTKCRAIEEKKGDVGSRGSLNEDEDDEANIPVL